MRACFLAAPSITERTHKHRRLPPSLSFPLAKRQSLIADKHSPTWSTVYAHGHAIPVSKPDMHTHGPERSLPLTCCAACLTSAARLLSSAFSFRFMSFKLPTARRSKCVQCEKYISPNHAESSGSPGLAGFCVDESWMRMDCNYEADHAEKERRKKNEKEKKQRVEGDL